MTRKEMNNISKEIRYIEKRLDILSSNNSIEGQERRRLLKRLDFLEYKVNHLISEKKYHLKLVSS